MGFSEEAERPRVFLIYPGFLPTCLHSAGAAEHTPSELKYNGYVL